MCKIKWPRVLMDSNCKYMHSIDLEWSTPSLISAILLNKDEKAFSTWGCEGCGWHNLLETAPRKFSNTSETRTKPNWKQELYLLSSTYFLGSQVLHASCQLVGAGHQVLERHLLFGHPVDVEGVLHAGRAPRPQVLPQVPLGGVFHYHIQGALGWKNHRKSKVRLILNFFFFFNVKKLLVRYNNLTESIKWESGKHGFKRK